MRVRTGVALSLVLCSLGLGAAEEESVDVLVLTSGAVEAAAAEIEALAGAVRLRYRGVPALAARIPATRIPELRSREGVLAVEKDQRLALEDPLGPARAERLSRLGMQRLQVRARGVRRSEPSRALAVPSTYLNYVTSGAMATWLETGFGKGSIVAVVDTGTHPVEPCLSEGQVIGEGFDSWADNETGGNPATAADNHPHGTWVASLIASSCELELASDDPLVAAFERHAPGVLMPDGSGTFILPLFGMAPGGQVYPVKVFPREGGETPVSEVLQGLDHLLELKTSGALDVDVVNLSLSGPALAEGRSTFDRFVDELRRQGMLVVAATGNSGPVPSTVGSPATSFSALSVGAIDDVFSSRVFYEWLGLVVGFGEGQGFVMRPDTEARIANFSSRGPLGDRRVAPLIAALGTWSFVHDASGFQTWVAGTSFASASVAGAAALLNAFAEAEGLAEAPCTIRNALLLGANPERVGEAWRDRNDQGLGVLDVPAALERLKSLDPAAHHAFDGCVAVVGDRLEANALGRPRPGRRERFRSGVLRLSPSQVRDFVFEIDDSTSRVLIRLDEMRVPDNAGVAVFPNALEVDVQSAKRSALPRPVDIPVLEAADVEALGGELEIEIEDDEWMLGGETVARQPMEPGLMKLSLAGDLFNQSAVSVRARITRENFENLRRHPRAKGFIHDDQILIIPVWVPRGTQRATFDLEWRRDWSRFPTSDLDLLLFDTSCLFRGGCELNADAATLNAPERATVEGPQPGLWLAVVVGFEVPRLDRYRLFVGLE